MTKEKFEELKKHAESRRKEYEEYSLRIGSLIGMVECYKDLTREEILELMKILFLNEK